MGRYRRQVYALAYRRLGDVTEADDATQETFVRAYVHLASYRPGTRFASWLLTIATHWCIDHHRRQAMRTRRAVPPARLDIHLAAEADEPEAVAVEAEHQRALGTWRGTLPAHYRQVIDLYYFDDLSYNEISQRLDKPVSTVRLRLHRARQVLKHAGHPMHAGVPT